MQRQLHALLLTCALTPLTLAIALSAKTASGVAQQPPLKSNPYRNSQIPCPTVLPPDEVEGKTMICGVVTLPENYSKPQGRQIELTYALLKSTSLSPQPDPLLVLHGGPGASDISYLELFIPLYTPQRRSRDVILFDQRGSQYSGDLACTPSSFILARVINAPGNELARKFAQFAKKYSSPLYPDGKPLAALSICASILAGHGADLNQYTTTNNARDAINLASALGYEKVNLYGISYGTYLAMRMMRDHPQRLRSVVLDSTLPPQLKKYEVTPRNYEVPLLNLIEDCQNDSACNQAYPNLKTRTIALLAALDKKPIPFSLPKTAGDKNEPKSGTVTPASIEVLVNAMNRDKRFPPFMPLLLTELEQGITTTFVGVVTEKIFTTPAPPIIPIGRPERLQMEINELREQARKLLSQKFQLAESQRPSRQWVKQVLDAIETLPEKDRIPARGNFYGVGYESGRPRDRNNLVTTIAEIFPVNKRAALTQSLQTLPSAEIRHVYEVIGEIFRSAKITDEETASGALRSFDCHDLAPPSSPAQTDAVFKQMEIPELGRSLLTASKQAYAICQIWPVKPAPARDAEVVKSNIPTLVLQDRYDNQAPTTYGKRAMEGLTKGTYLEFPDGGHGALAFSECAKEVGAAFVNNPSRPPNAECRKDLKVKFVLPTPSAK